MLKEIKYLLFLLIIGIFLFITIKYYFSDTHKKKSFRSMNSIEEKINIYADKLPVLENDTKNIIEYVEKSNEKKKRKKLISGLLESNE